MSYINTIRDAIPVLEDSEDHSSSWENLSLQGLLSKRKSPWTWMTSLYNYFHKHTAEI